MERDLRYTIHGVECERNLSDILEFESDGAGERGVHHCCSRDNQATATPRTSTDHIRKEIFWQPHELERPGEHELVRMDYQRRAEVNHELLKRWFREIVDAVGNALRPRTNDRK